jgi:tetratricopeptide (TPR) repeat protein
LIFKLALAIVLATTFATTAAADAFGLALHANGGSDTTLYRGEPLLVQTLLILEQDEAATVALAGGQPWTRALSLTLLDGAGQAVPLEWATLGAAPASSLAFTPEATEISAVMALAPAVLDALPPGDYRLEALFSTEESAAPGAWKGEVRAPRVALKLSAEQRPNSPPEQVYRHRLLARWHQLNDRHEAALTELDAALEQMPGDVQALSDKADVLVEMNRGDEATAVLQQAVSLYRQQHPDATHPPRWLLRRLQELDTYSVAAAGTTNDAAPTAIAAPPTAVPPAAAAPAATPPATAAAPPAQEQPAAGPRHWVGDAALPAAADGQWAVAARAGSQYGEADYSALRATGAPDVPGADDHPNAWCPALRDSGSDWLELSFEQAAPATEVRVRQSFGPGAIVKVEAIEPDGQGHTWWEGVDPFGQDGFADDAVWFGVRVPLTTYDVQKIRLTLDLGAHSRWKQIDAVQLLGATPR